MISALLPKRLKIVVSQWPVGNNTAECRLKKTSNWRSLSESMGSFVIPCWFIHAPHTHDLVFLSLSKYCRRFFGKQCHPLLLLSAPAFIDHLESAFPFDQTYIKLLQVLLREPIEGFTWRILVVDLQAVSWSFSCHRREKKCLWTTLLLGLLWPKYRSRPERVVMCAVWSLLTNYKDYLDEK